MTPEQQNLAREAITARLNEVGMTRYALGKRLGWPVSLAYMLLDGSRAMTWGYSVEIAQALWPRRKISRRALRAIFGQATIRRDEPLDGMAGRIQAPEEKAASATDA